MKKQIRLAILSIFATFTMLSCSKDEVGSGGNSGSRDVKYEITGNYSGNLIVAAATNNGVTEAFEVDKLPWSTSFTAKSSVNTLVMVVTGGAGKLGKKGETVTLKIYVGGKEVDASTGTALSDGIISVSTIPYILR